MCKSVSKKCPKGKCKKVFYHQLLCCTINDPYCKRWFVELAKVSSGARADYGQNSETDFLRMFLNHVFIHLSAIFTVFDFFILEVLLGTYHDIPIQTQSKSNITHLFTFKVLHWLISRNYGYDLNSSSRSKTKSFLSGAKLMLEAAPTRKRFANWISQHT